MTGFFLLATMIVHGQDVSTIQDVDKQAFVEIFWDVKEFPIVDDSIITDVLREAGLTHDRYAEIISSGLKGDPDRLSDSEEVAVAHIRSVHENHIQGKKAYLKTVCNQFGLTVEQYYDILNTYRSDIAFQQSMRPYFEAYLREQKQ